MTDVQRAAVPWRRDLVVLESGLASWARSWRGDRATVTGVIAPDSGMANDTVLFQLDGDPLVARLAPASDAPYPTFPTYDLHLQRRVIDIVRARTDVPAPEIVHLEDDEKWLGAPFMVARAVEGLVPSDNPPYLVDPGGWFLRGTLEQWRRFEVSTIDVLVRLHHVVDDGDLAFLRTDTPGETALARQLAYQRTYYEWARDGHSVPTLERAFDALSATMPANDGNVLNWGDSRPGNIIYRDFEPAAVLDWEMATVGPPEVDLAWLTFFQRFFAHLAEQFGLPPVPAMFDPAKTAASYERLSGDELDALAWYEAFAGVRFGIILARMTLRSVAFGLQEMPARPDDMMMFAPLLDRLVGAL